MIEKDFSWNIDLKDLEKTLSNLIKDGYKRSLFLTTLDEEHHETDSSYGH